MAMYSHCDAHRKDCDSNWKQLQKQLDINSFAVVVSLSYLMDPIVFFSRTYYKFLRHFCTWADKESLPQSLLELEFFFFNWYRRKKTIFFLAYFAKKLYWTFLNTEVTILAIVKQIFCFVFNYFLKILKLVMWAYLSKWALLGFRIIQIELNFFLFKTESWPVRYWKRLSVIAQSVWEAT